MQQQQQARSFDRNSNGQGGYRQANGKPLRPSGVKAPDMGDAFLRARVGRQVTVTLVVPDREVIIGVLKEVGRFTLVVVVGGTDTMVYKHAIALVR